MKYLFAYESETYGFNTRDELDKAIDNNRRDSKRSHKIFDQRQASTSCMPMADNGMANLPDSTSQQMNSLLPLLALVQARKYNKLFLNFAHLKKPKN